ncbi:MAG: hypothetical protein KY476_16885 [Planctomycetes bacterium]|nr:hypothetical protein [Planctomycetota bacterium]
MKMANLDAGTVQRYAALALGAGACVWAIRGLSIPRLAASLAGVALVALGLNGRLPSLQWRRNRGSGFVPKDLADDRRPLVDELIVEFTSEEPDRRREDLTAGSEGGGRTVGFGPRL